MKKIQAFALLVATCCNGAPFDRQHVLFGVRAGGYVNCLRNENPNFYFAEEAFVKCLIFVHLVVFDSSSALVTEDDYERAQSAIFQAVSRVEGSMEKALHDEVDVFFHKQEHHDKRNLIQERTETLVEEGSQKVGSQVDDHDINLGTLPFETHPFPYAWPQPTTAHQDHRILHAIGNAEKVIVHAVKDQVGTLFHDLGHHEKEALHGGVKKATKTIKESQEHRSVWLGTDTDKAKEDYFEYGIE
jgi:hypothetical protein